MALSCLRQQKQFHKPFHQFLCCRPIHWYSPFLRDFYSLCFIGKFRHRSCIMGERKCQNDTDDERKRSFWKAMLLVNCISRCLGGNGRQKTALCSGSIATSFECRNTVCSFCFSCIALGGGMAAHSGVRNRSTAAWPLPYTSVS